MSTLPTWAIYAVSLGTPLTAFLGVILGQWLSRKGAAELDTWRRREETMRMLRWASELATSPNGASARMGVAALAALSKSELLQAPDEQLVEAVLDFLLEEPLEEIEEGNEDTVQVIEIDSTDGA